MWPEGKKFAFTVFDDTDSSNLENTKPVYDYLEELNIRITKSCWVRSTSDFEKSKNPGSSIENHEYRLWLLDLQKKGFEIALHGVSAASSRREQIIEGIAGFVETFGLKEFAYANHSGQKESVYWGADRVSGMSRSMYQIMLRYILRRNRDYEGTINESEYYWGDYLKKYVKYIRGFTFMDINTLKTVPEMPYRNQSQSYANYWFVSTDGCDCKKYCSVLSKENVDRLVDEGGLCVMYTHYAFGFVAPDGSLNPEFRKVMDYISTQDGWFAPLSKILDYVNERRGDVYLTPRKHRQYSRRWMFEKMINGGAAE